MYINEIKELVERLDAFSKMSTKGGNWSEYVRKTVKELEDALDGLKRELDVRDTKTEKLANHWEKADTVFNEWN